MTVTVDQEVTSTQRWPVEVSHRVLGVATNLAGWSTYAALQDDRYPSPSAVDFDDDSIWTPIEQETIDGRFVVWVPVGDEYNSITLAAGRYHLFIGLDDGATERPVLHAGVIKVK